MRTRRRTCSTDRKPWSSHAGYIGLANSFPRMEYTRGASPGGHGERWEDARRRPPPLSLSPLPPVRLNAYFPKFGRVLSVPLRETRGRVAGRKTLTKRLDEN